MKRFKKIAIIGVGLIGGSIGLAVKKRNLAGEVTGIFRRRSSLVKALKAKAVDRGTQDFRSGIEGADLVVVATPVSLIPRMAKLAAPFMKRGAILTDVGSVKGYVAREVQKILPDGVEFIGAHPMAGSEKTGVQHARSDLFKGALTILIDARGTDRKALGILRDFWKALGSRVTVLSPEEHDRRIAFISHLPHIVAQSLCLVQEKGNTRFAAGGFRDTTRVASSDPSMWIDIFSTNKVYVGKALDRLIEDLNIFKTNLKRNDLAKIMARMRKARNIREGRTV